MKKGFTLFELLLVIAGFGILASIAVPFSNSSIVRGNLEANSRAIESFLRRAYTYSRASENDSNWGVHIENNVMTIFSGESYADRDTNFDETNTLPKTITISGTLLSNDIIDVIFTKGEGLPQNTGTITLTAEQTEKTITVSAIGSITVTSS